VRRRGYLAYKMTYHVGVAGNEGSLDLLVTRRSPVPPDDPESRGVLPAHLAGDENGFGELYAGPDSELREDLPQVVVHGVRADEEL